MSSKLHRNRNPFALALITRRSAGSGCHKNRPMEERRQGGKKLKHRTDLKRSREE
jgi:hypothetical protein